jgi:hypothetical protein
LKSHEASLRFIKKRFWESEKAFGQQPVNIQRIMVLMITGVSGAVVDYVE